LAPIWEELSEKLKFENENDGIIIADLDVTKHPEVAKRFGIQGYPTLKYFADRKLFTYKGSRSLLAMYDFVTEDYKEGPQDTIPPLPSWFDTKVKELRKWFEAATDDNQHLKYLLEDFEHILEFRKNAAGALLVIGGMFGFLLGVMLTLLSTMRGSDKPKRKKD